MNMSALTLVAPYLAFGGPALRGAGVSRLGAESVDGCGLVAQFFSLIWFDLV
jgi:hypothetical protein